MDRRTKLIVSLAIVGIVGYFLYPTLKQSVVGYLARRRAPALRVAAAHAWRTYEGCMLGSAPLGPNEKRIDRLIGIERAYEVAKDIGADERWPSKCRPLLQAVTDRTNELQENLDRDPSAPHTSSFLTTLRFSATDGWNRFFDDGDAYFSGVVAEGDPTKTLAPLPVGSPKRIDEDEASVASVTPTPGGVTHMILTPLFSEEGRTLLCTFGSPSSDGCNDLKLPSHAIRPSLFDGDDDAPPALFLVPSDPDTTTQLLRADGRSMPFPWIDDVWVHRDERIDAIVSTGSALSMETIHADNSIHKRSLPAGVDAATLRWGMLFMSHPAASGSALLLANPAADDAAISLTSTIGTIRAPFADVAGCRSGDSLFLVLASGDAPRIAELAMRIGGTWSVVPADALTPHMQKLSCDEQGLTTAWFNAPPQPIVHMVRCTATGCETRDSSPIGGNPGGGTLEAYALRDRIALIRSAVTTDAFSFALRAAVWSRVGTVDQIATAKETLLFDSLWLRAPDGSSTTDVISVIDTALVDNAKPFVVLITDPRGAFVVPLDLGDSQK